MPGLAVSVPSLDIEQPRPGAEVAPGGVLQEWHDHDGQLIATGGRDQASWWMHWPGLAMFRFGDHGAVRVEPVRAGLDDTLQDVFVRGVVPVVLLARGFEALHASAVVDGRGVIGLCGTSGTGKSTLALALASGGLTHFADDALAYSLEGGTPHALRLPFPVRVDPPARQAITGRVLPFRRPGTLDRPPIRLIYQLRRDPALRAREPRFSPVAPQKRFEALLRHAHPFDMGGETRRANFIANVLELARTVVVWECAFAPDLDALPSLAAAIGRHASLE